MASRHSEYKKQNMEIWDELAPRYHRRWAAPSMGPWKSTEKLINISGVKKGDKVLDLACGTGAVTKKIAGKVGGKGLVIGIDSSLAAIKVAKKWSPKTKNLDFINSDAEKFNLNEKFDVITCQYALFFFPNSQKALKNMARNLKETGVLGISVHGNYTPYYTSIQDVVKKFIPDYLPTGSTRLDRFGSASSLKKEITKAGYRQVQIKEFVFSYSPGTIQQYWGNYCRYVAKPVKEKLSKLNRKQKLEVLCQIKQKVTPYTKKGGKIVFPWQVLISTAKPPITHG